MNEVVDAVEDVGARLAVLARDVFTDHGLHGMNDERLLEAVRAVGDVQRLVEAVLVEAVGEVCDRSRQMDRRDRLCVRVGCHNVNELVQRLTRCSPQTAGRLEKAQQAVAVDWDAITGDAHPAKLPSMRDALRDGQVGVDGVGAVAGPLLGMRDRAARTSLLAADAAIAEFACGEGADEQPPACADLLRVQALVWAAALDPDGDEPVDRDAARKRGFTLGRMRDGLVPFRGNAMPEVAAQLQRIFDAINSPRVNGRAAEGVWFRPAEERGVDGAANGGTDGGDSDGGTDRRAGRSTESDTDGAANGGTDGGTDCGTGGGVAGTAGDSAGWVDMRTRAQKQHDALAAALFAAARSAEMPLLGGAAPTVMVTVNAEDLARGAGWAFLEGVEQPVSINTATHTACAGVLQRVVLGEDGRIIELGSTERVFTPAQRRAITLRDGGCLIPGCGVPASWCEIHHVTDHARGGPTHTDNGVMLCWSHHRFIDTGPWDVRMTDGVPEIRGPVWFDTHRRWRRVTKSKVRILRNLRTSG